MPEKPSRQARSHGGRGRSCQGGRRCRSRRHQRFGLDHCSRATRAAHSRRAGGGRRMGVGARRADARGARGSALSRRTKHCAAEAFEPMRAVVYDTAVLIAADRGQRRTWAEHRVRLAAGIIPWCPPLCLRKRAARRAAQMRRLLLRGCEIAPFDGRQPTQPASLLGKTRTHDVVDASLAVLRLEAQQTSSAPT